MENLVTFGTLQRDGTLTNVKRIKQSTFGNCPFTIFMPNHYREDGSCKCSNTEHRKMMIKKWGYKTKDFKNTPLVD